MAFFGKKNKNEDVSAPEVEVSNKASKKAKNRGKKSGMSQVLKESVPATVADELRDNEAFIHHVGGEEKYVGLLLNVSDIGGLDKKSRKDEAKGAFIEAINGGNIKTVITSELMDNDQLVIIADSTTMSNMLDFGMLESVDYTLVYVDANANTNEITITPVEPETKLTFADISEHIVEQEETIDDILGSDEPEEDENVFSDDASSDFYEDDDEEKDVIPEDDDIDEIEDIDNLDGLEDAETGATYGGDVEPPVDDDTSYEDISGADIYSDNTGSPDAYDVAMDDGPVQEKEDEVPDEWMDAVITRKFYSDDLGLEITTEPFDAQFMQNNPYVPFDENRPEGWLNDQLNEMSREANLEMARMHRGNLFLMRERYFKLISKHCDRIQKDLDITDERTQYGQILESLRNARENELANVDMRVARKKEDLDASWKRKLQEVGQDAARAAQHQYRERYGKQHDAEIYNLEDDVRSSIEDDYHDAIHEMNDRRRVEASKLLDLGITEVLEEISDMYVGALEDENARYQELEENMKAFLDDNRQNDIARSQALAEDLRQSDKADSVLAEQTEKIRNMTAEFNSKRQSLENEIAQMKRENADRIADIQSHSDELLKREQDRNADLQRQIDDLRQQNANMHQIVGAEYASRINEKENEVRSLHDRLEDATYQQKHSNLITTYLVIAIAIAALAIGFVSGSFINLNRQTQATQQQMIEEYQNEQQNSSQGG